MVEPFAETRNRARAPLVGIRLFARTVLARVVGHAVDTRTVRLSLRRPPPEAARP